MATKTVAKKTGKSSVKTVARKPLSKAGKAAQSMLAASMAKKGPAPKRMTAAEREAQAKKDRRAIAKADMGPGAVAKTKARLAREQTTKGKVKRPADKEAKSVQTHVVEYVFDKSTKTAHVYRLPTNYKGAIKSATQYLPMDEFPKAPKRITVKFVIG